MKKALQNLNYTNRFKLTYRIANLSDFEKLKSLGKESYNEFSKILTKENWGKMNTSLESDKTLTTLIEKSVVYICEKESEIIGMIYFVSSVNATELFKDDWSYIRFLGVNTKFRGNGIGKKLTDLCIDYAKNTDEKYIALHTSEFMGVARRIYEERGFKKVSEIKYLGKRYWIYLLDLSNSNH